MIVVVIYGIKFNKDKTLLDLPNMSSVDKSEILKSVGLKIKKLRETKGLSQVDLVGKMQGNIDTTNISRIESGRTNPTLYTLYRIAEALEVKVNDLIEY